MSYILALFIPPLGVLVAGKPFQAVFLFIVWFLALMISIILGHLLVVVVSWVIIGAARGDRRHRELLEATRSRKPE